MHPGSDPAASARSNDADSTASGEKHRKMYVTSLPPARLKSPKTASSQIRRKPRSGLSRRLGHPFGRRQSATSVRGVHGRKPSKSH